MLTTAVLDAAGEKFQRAARAESTWRAYQSDWKDFVEWCTDRQVAAVPAEAETVARYLVALAAAGLKPATLYRRLASISVVCETLGHPNPTRDRMIRDRLSGIVRVMGTAQAQAAPATTAEIRKMVASLESPATGGRRPATNLHAVRDRAIILVGFAAALRRSELAGLNLADIRSVPQGLEVSIRRSKTDQWGAGVVVAVPYGSHHETCPVRSLNEWITAAELAPTTDRGTQALFRSISPDGWLLGRMSGQAVSQVVARAAKRAGLDPNANWSGHSLRAGLATSAARAGVPDRVIMATTRHRSRTTLDRYIREGKRWDKVAAASVGL